MIDEFNEYIPDDIERYAKQLVWLIYRFEVRCYADYIGIKNLYHYYCLNFKKIYECHRIPSK